MFKYEKILFIVNPFHKGCHPVFLQALLTLQKNNYKCYLEKAIISKLSDPESLGSYSSTTSIDIPKITELTSSNKSSINLAIAFGGDGTILHLSKIYFDSPSGTPDLLAFNFGSLGYLCSFELTEVPCVLKYVFGCSFWELQESLQSEELSEMCISKVVRKRLGIKLGKERGGTFEMRSFHFEGGREDVEVGTEFYALNEINVRAEKIGETVRLELYVNGKFLTTYEGFGLVFCTPTGSTSYNLSLHGAIIQNDVDCFGIISIWNTTSIAMKPIILPPDAVVTVKNLSEGNKGTRLGNWDGSLIFEYEYGDTLTISGCDSPIPQLMQTTKDPVKDWIIRLKEKLNCFEP